MSRGNRFASGAVSIWDQLSEVEVGSPPLGFEKIPRAQLLPDGIDAAAEVGQEGVAKADHVHAGVGAIEYGSELIRGIVTLIAGPSASIDFDVDEREITISANIMTTARVTDDYTISESDHTIFCDTDGGAIALTLPVGIEGQTYRIINCGSSGNDVTVSGDTATELVRNAASQTVSDFEIMILTFNETEYWW